MYLCMSAGIVFCRFVLYEYEGAYRVFLTGCAELQNVTESLQVKMLYQHMSVYQPLHRYTHFNISKHFMMLYGISHYEPPSPSRFPPPLAVSTPSYLFLLLSIGLACELTRSHCP